MDTELVSHALCGAFRHAMIYAYRKQMPREELVAELLRFLDRAMELETMGGRQA
ncbi:MAG: hypothetical protein U5O39_04940 [Gammaproteobacteria bacterium]|nr:hypothetical protein [Gammaproteobacteria bacterium]